jgi:UTP--glucose-1-phosphate uridylyltransferase
MLRKVIIPAAGLGTRLLPATKEQPKEMLPVFATSASGLLCIKPFVQLVFERLYDAGFRDFCFIVGRGKRSIEDHFTLGRSFSEHLERKNGSDIATEMAGFYEKIKGSNLMFVNQSEPKGFGDALLHAKHFTGNETFLVHAGDDLILSKNNRYLSRLTEALETHSADAILYMQRVKDPRKYGVIEGRKISPSLYQVIRIEEKPLSAFSNLAAIAIYGFTPRIYIAIEKTEPDVNGEVQLTGAIQQLINERRVVLALNLEKGDRRIDIGTPGSYWDVLKAARKQALQERV